MIVALRAYAIGFAIGLVAMSIGPAAALALHDVAGPTMPARTVG